MMICLVAVLKVKAELQEKVAQASVKMAEAVRLQEKGCLMYEPYIPVDGAAEIVFIEKYTGLEALEEHRRTPHYKEFARSIQDSLEGPPEVKVLNPVEQS
jgi:quinol monooxygenase YgiN